MNNFQKLIDEYSADYCLFLEATYAEGMMSEGGSESIDHMFEGIDLLSKKMLDIGFGLGGIEFYLADKYQAQLTGIELNPWVVEEATRRTPDHLKSLVNFQAYQNPPLLPFKNSEFDIVFSKGVLTHVEEKLPLFNEVFRVLKPGGLFIVNDWLSEIKNQWGNRLKKMCEIENLTLYAETKIDYQNYLKASGFSSVSMRDENHHYIKYNHDIVHRLQSENNATAFIAKFGEEAWKAAIEGYQLIADSMKDNELLVTWIRAEKEAFI